MSIVNLLQESLLIRIKNITKHLHVVLMAIDHILKSFNEHC